MLKHLAGLTFLALFAVVDCFVLLGSPAFAQTVVNRNPPAPASYNGSAYYTPQEPNGTTTITDTSQVNNGVTTDQRVINNSQALFTPNSYSQAGFTPTPQNYAQSGMPGVTTRGRAPTQPDGNNPNAQFAPAATANTAASVQSTAAYNAAAQAGVNAMQPALNNANANANAVNSSHSTATYNGE